MGRRMMTVGCGFEEAPRVRGIWLGMVKTSDAPDSTARDSVVGLCALDKVGHFQRENLARRTCHRRFGT